MTGESGPIEQEVLEIIHEDSQATNKNKRKQNFNRKNIKQFSDHNVNDQTKAAQQAEVDRQKRMQNEEIDDENDTDVIITDQTTASSRLFQAKWISPEVGGFSADKAIVVEDFDNDIEEAAVIELCDNDEPEVIETEVCEIRDAENLPDRDGQILINKNKRKNEPEVYLAKHLVPIIKPHQVSGVRFMYENVVENPKTFNENEGFGCILAHSMGLGKTIQVISFTDLLFRYCQAKRVLIILPINTIQNWKAEFDKWLPKRPSSFFKRKSESGDETPTEDSKSPTPKEENPSSPEEYDRNFEVHIIRDTHKTINSRYEVIRSWLSKNGVLLIGYEMFRLLAFPKNKNSFFVDETGSEEGATSAKPKKKKRRKKSSGENSECEEEQEPTKKVNIYEVIHYALINPGPQVVICDEGHRIKNSEASTSKALKSMKTKRRVVLTGYPLQNNLMEYWCMVDFVRPMYLGTKQEFTNIFQRPIENGQCIDSTPQDRKIMQGRAHVLHDLLQGFVQRRSHMVLKASLPEKNEVVIFIKLSPIQRQLYATFMNSIQSGGSLGYGSVSILKTYAMCCKIWNHPDILRRALRELGEEEDLDFDEFISSISTSAKDPTKTKGKRKNSKSSTQVKSKNLTPDIREVFDSHSLPLNEATVELPINEAPVEFTINEAPAELPSQSPIDSNSQDIGSEVSISSVPQPIPQIYDFGSQMALTGSYPTRHAPVNCISNFKPKGPVIDAKKFFSQIATIQQTGTYDWAKSEEAWTLPNDPEFKGYEESKLEYSGKMIILMELLNECIKAGDRMLVFSQSLFTLDLIEQFLKQNKIPVTTNVESDQETTLETNNWVKNKTYFRLDGSTPPSERERQIQHFNKPQSSLRLFLISTRAGCLGINLIGANRVVVFDASWNPCHDCQAVCRVYRYGQQKRCFIYRLVSDNTMERKIYDRQVTKQSMSDRVVDESNPSQQFTRSQVERLCQFDDIDQETLKESDLQECRKVSNDDPVLDSVIENNMKWITKVPFTHESLLIDRKDCSLTKVEKRLAKQSYEIEKRATNKYTAANQYHKSQFNSIQQLQRQSGINLADYQRQFKWSKGPTDNQSAYRASPGILSRSRGNRYQTLPSGDLVIEPDCFNPYIQEMREQDKQERVKMLQKEIEAARKRYFEENSNRLESSGQTSSKRKQAFNGTMADNSNDGGYQQQLSNYNNNNFYAYNSGYVDPNYMNQQIQQQQQPHHLQQNYPAPSNYPSTIPTYISGSNPGESFYPQLIDQQIQQLQNQTFQMQGQSDHQLSANQFQTQPQ